MKPAAILPLYLSLLFLTATPTSANPLNVPLPPPLTLPPLNTTLLRSDRTNCFGRDLRQRLYPAEYNDCRRALEDLLSILPQNPLHFSQIREKADFRVPYTQTYKTCKIQLFTKERDDVAETSARDIEVSLLEQDVGVVSRCLHNPRPYGGHTSLGWKVRGGQLLHIDVRGVRVFN